MAIVFNGRGFAKKKEQELKKAFSRASLLKNRRARLVSVLVGDDPASQLYLRIKKEAAQRLGVDFKLVELEEESKPAVLAELLKDESADPETDGVMVQLPLPPSWSKEEKQSALDFIDPKKDIDGLTSVSLGLIVAGKTSFLPATVEAIWQILLEAGIDDRNIKGKTTCILGRSDIVGKPLANLLINKKATVSVCGRSTPDLVYYTSVADIIISATGAAGLVKKEMVKKGAVVIDVGEPKGDVDFAGVSQKASFVTPVPRGVGPVTVVCLFENLLKAFAQGL
jgi:methylenetetrahydrofolate dehydrogenase (NADP+)/methenyltetrahydrofolate cyclohydrolase